MVTVCIVWAPVKPAFLDCPIVTSLPEIIFQTLYYIIMTKTTNTITAHMASTAYMGVTMNNVQQCATPATGEGGGDINFNIQTGGNLIIDGMDLTETSTESVSCFYSPTNQASLTQSLTDTLTAMAENDMGYMDSLITSALTKDTNSIITGLVQGAVQKVQINNMQNCGIGSNDINVNFDVKGNANIDNFTASNNSYTYLSCIFDSNNVANLSQELAATTNDSATNTKKNPFSGLDSMLTLVVFGVIFVGLIIGGFIMFRITDGMFKSNGAPSVAQQTIRASGVA